VSERTGHTVAAVAIAASTAIVLLGVAILPFLSPAWVAFEQDRSGAATWTGYTAAELRQATNAILADLLVGPPDFDVTVGDQAVLTARERAHMADVRGAFVGLAVVAGGAIVVLIAGYLVSRGSPRFWRSVRGGAIVLVGGIVVVGAIGIFAFDAAFEVFHRLFFAGGTYTFDPATDRLVQLFPEAFWYETSVAVGIVALAMCGLVAWLGGRRLGSEARDAATVRVPLEANR